MSNQLGQLAGRIRDELVEIEVDNLPVLFTQVRAELLAFAEFLEQRSSIW